VNQSDTNQENGSIASTSVFYMCALGLLQNYLHVDKYNNMRYINQSNKYIVCYITFMSIKKVTKTTKQTEV